MSAPESSFYELLKQLVVAYRDEEIFISVHKTYSWCVFFSVSADPEAEYYKK